MRERMDLRHRGEEPAFVVGDALLGDDDPYGRVMRFSRTVSADRVRPLSPRANVSPRATSII